MSARTDIPTLSLVCCEGLEVLEVDHLDLGGGRARLRVVPHAAEGSDHSVHLDEARARELFIWLGKWLHAS